MSNLTGYSLMKKTYHFPAQEKDVLAFDALMKFCTEQPGYYAIVHWAYGPTTNALVLTGPYDSASRAQVDIDFYRKQRGELSMYSFAVAGNGTCYGESNA